MISQPGLNRTALFLPRGPQHAGEFENAAIFQRLDLPSTINRQDQNGAFSETLFKPEEFKRRLCVLVWRKNSLKTKLFGNKDITITIPSFPQTQIRNDR